MAVPGALASLLGGGLATVVIAISVLEIPHTARLMHSVVLILHFGENDIADDGLGACAAFAALERLMNGCAKNSVPRRSTASPSSTVPDAGSMLVSSTPSNARLRESRADGEAGGYVARVAV